MTFSFVSFFSGGMGLDIGLERAGGTIYAANEIDAAAVRTIKANMPDIPVFEQSIADLSGAEVLQAIGMKQGELDLVVGGPPCQSFSVYGNRSGIGDPRGQLVFEYVRMIGELLPKAFIMENVRGLHSMPLIPPKLAASVDGYHKSMSAHGSLLREIYDQFYDLGYHIDGYLVNAVNYGAPQIRERLLLIGNRIGSRANFPAPTHSNRQEDGLPPFTRLRDAILDGFEDNDSDIMDFSPRKKHYLQMVPPGGNWRSLPEEIQKESMGKSWYLKGGRSATWRRLDWNFPSPTVVTMPNHASTSMCHPDHVRALTVGECAAIQEFPRDWKLQGSAAEKYRQIGNAVPVRLGLVAGSVVQQLLAASGRHDNLTKDYAIKHLRPHVRTKSYWRNGEAFAGATGYYDEPAAEQFSFF
ncbi:DNA cytosine methyltransferase [Agrobacterium larrymoorei]|uniref:Cytosine-specific methyltransferase n=1 Tax=Agrobacterium larrymoorei TaxID=160699 RepID=A0ABU0UGY4_9HYPH|nr:DNA cytosine methyltransferase [Agrobacterium larrymoorei]MDQ1184192.1 DNA (cytosine-5)-methyltransferase 1 [Agrobacterium larrymoorei]